jgi:hypothetical protein
MSTKESKEGASAKFASESSKLKKDEEEAKQEEVVRQSFSHQIELVRIKIKKFLSSHIIGQLYSEMLLYFSIFSTLQFVHSTYVDITVVTDTTRVLNIIEMALAALFGFDWLLSFFIADHKLEFVTRYYSTCDVDYTFSYLLVDLLTIIPIWATLNMDQIEFNKVFTFSQGLTYLLYGLSTTRVLRALRIHRKLSQLTDEVQRSLGEMIVTVLVLLLFSKFPYFGATLIQCMSDLCDMS